MEIAVALREIIKPSHPTSHKLRHMKLSFLDQLLHRHFLPLIYFYSPGGGIHSPKTTEIPKADNLKKSLAETLTRFYPLAGRLRENLYIDCNDEGVPYSEARVKTPLAKILKNPNDYHSQLNRLLPCDRLDDAGDIPFAVQVNYFDCGGMAIGMCFSHKLVDGLSIVKFINTWAAANRGDHSSLMSPCFDMSMLFPPTDKSPHETGSGITKDKIVAKRFVFSAFAISALKAKYSRMLNSQEGVMHPSRVEAVTTFIWSRFMGITREAHQRSTKSCYVVTQAVNLRTKTNPPLPETYFGNLSWLAMATSSMSSSNDTQEEGYGLITQIREALRKVNIDSVNKLNDSKGSTPMDALRNTETGVRFMFTSFSKFPIYEADFGWGRPEWVSMATQPYNNLACLLPTKLGDGFEAWINLKENDMTKLEADEEFRAFTSSSCKS